MQRATDERDQMQATDRLRKALVIANQPPSTGLPGGPSGECPLGWRVSKRDRFPRRVDVRSARQDIRSLSRVWGVATIRETATEAIVCTIYRDDSGIHFAHLHVAIDYIRARSVSRRDCTVPFRYRRRVRIAKGLTLNLGKRGINSVTFGRRGASMNVSGKGTRETYGLPGTGMSYQTKRKALSGCGGCVLPVLAVVATVAVGIKRLR